MSVFSSPVLQGEQFVFYEDWGETLVSKSSPVLCVLDIEGSNVSVLEGVPDNISPGQVSTVCVCCWVPFLCVCCNVYMCCISVITCVPRRFGLRVTQAWCSWAGGMSPSDWASNTRPTAGEHCDWSDQSGGYE